MTITRFFFSKKVWINIALMLPFMFSMLAGWAAWQISGLSSSLVSRGETTVAIVFNKRILGGNGVARPGQTTSPIEFNIYYQFTTPTETVKSQSDLLRKEVYDRYRIGQKIKVRYLPEDPKFNEIVNGRKNSENATAAAGMAIFFAVIGFLAIGVVKISSVKTKEQDEGLIAPSSLTENDSSNRSNVPD